jgi:hypothetical protein
MRSTKTYTPREACINCAINLLLAGVVLGLVAYFHEALFSGLQFVWEVICSVGTVMASYSRIWGSLIFVTMALTLWCGCVVYKLSGQPEHNDFRYNMCLFQILSTVSGMALYFAYAACLPAHSAQNDRILLAGTLNMYLITGFFPLFNVMVEIEQARKDKSEEDPSA